tara:strand:- start:454 stop:1335 length:882 start_codon:yes stop_codon:yes gene_type:complete
LPLSDRQIGFGGLVVGIVGLLIAAASIWVATVLWRSRPPYDETNLVLTISDVRLVGESADVFFSVAADHLKKDIILAELPLGVINIGEASEEAVSISLNFFEVEGSSPGTSSDIGDLFVNDSPIPVEVNRTVAPGNGSFNIHYSIDRLLPGTSMLVGEPIQLPKPISMTEEVEFKDGNRADVSFQFEYSVSIPIVAAGSRKLIGSTTLQIHSFVGGENPLAAQRLHKFVSERVGQFRSSVGWFGYVFAGLAGETRGAYVAICDEKHVGEEEVLLQCDNVYRVEYNLFRWSRLF